MITNDETILKVKHDVLVEVAKLAWENQLDEEHVEELPYKMFPGPMSTYRCCVYKEREIIRQRIRLAEGKSPTYRNSINVVQVINAACEECPIASYTVTDNCRRCMGQACQNSCAFGAITITPHKAVIDPDKCRECGKCAAACPYNAIAHLERPCKKVCPANAITYDEYGICVIDEKKCIQCGHCIHSCPFGAIGTKTFLVDIIRLIKAGKRVYAMIAPAVEGQFGKDITFASWKKALKQLGFEDVIEVGLGGDLTAAFEAEEWAEAYKEGKKLTTSCCPAFVNYIKLHFPTLVDNISTTVSPMCGLSRMLKSKDPEIITVFIGPCIAKKSESLDLNIEGNADYVLTLGEIEAMMISKGVELLPEANSTQEASVFGKRFGNSGGVTAAVLSSLQEKGVAFDAKVCRCNGAAECKKALTLMKVGRLPEDFIEGMICEGGCVGGPSKHVTEMEAKKARDQLIGEADKRGVWENLSQHDLTMFSMHRSME